MNGAAKSLSISQRELLNAADPRPLFDRRLMPPGSGNDDAIVRQAISGAIRRCSKSREEIAEEMTTLVGVRVTEKMLNSYSGEANQPHRWPAAWDRAFCQITGDDTLLICRVQAAGLFVIDQTGRDLLELGRELLRQKQAAENAALLEARLRGVEL